MKSKELAIDIETMRVNVEATHEPKMVLISEGKAKIIDLPTHGEVKVITYKGKIQRFRFEEGEEF